MNNEFDVLVVGAGPVGLFAANELIRHGLSCHIIDKKNTLSEHSKAAAIHIRSLRMLDDSGFLAEVLQQGHKIVGMTFKAKGEIIMQGDFANVDAMLHYLIDLPQNKTEKIFYDGLRYKGQDVSWLTELTQIEQTEDSVIATVKNGETESQLKAKWLLACDGSHSTIRHLLNLNFVGAEYKEHWWLADVDLAWENPSDRMIAYLNEKGPSIFFPLGPKRYRIVTRVDEGEPENPSLEEFQSHVASRISDTFKISNPDWLTGFNIHHRQIEQYHHGRIFLAGDAAHIHSPMGGQGLNTGMQDVYNLAWKLAYVQHKKMPADILESYHIERHAVGKNVVHDSDRLTKMVNLNNPAAQFVRNHMMKLITSIPHLRNNMTSKMAELDISYKNSPIVKQQGNCESFSAGRLLPNIYLTKKHFPEYIFDFVRGTKFHLFIFAGLNYTNVDDIVTCATQVRDNYHHVIDTHLVLTSNISSLNWTGSIFYDFDHRAHQHINALKNCLFLIRPDKYITYASDVVNASALNNYLSTIFS